MASVTLEVEPGQPLPIYPGKSCGTCTACCSTVPVKEIGLAAFTRCPMLYSHRNKINQGCRVYAERPRSCSSWSCGWMLSNLPDQYKPNNLGVVLDPVPDLVRINGKEMVASQFWAIPGHEEDWQKPLVRRLIIDYFDRGLAVLWRVKDGGRQAARVMFRHEGQWVVSEQDYGKQELDGFKDDTERLQHAQSIMHGTG